MGIASSDSDIIQKAYIALNSAKTTNKKFQFFNTEIDTREASKRTLSIVKDIKYGLSQNRFFPKFQPIVNRDQKIIKYESLIRFMNDNDEVIAPFEFLDVATKSNQYCTISMMVMEKTFIKMSKKSVDFSINIDMQDIYNKDTTNFLKEQLSKYALYERVVFEILEDINNEDYSKIMNFVNTFRSLGVRFAIDDFGSGYSNFSNVIDLDPEYVKIDASFIKNIDTSVKSQIIVGSIINFAKKLDIKVIAEYVSSKEIFDILYEMGVDEYQGYYFGKPEFDLL